MNLILPQGTCSQKAEVGVENHVPHQDGQEESVLSNVSQSRRAGCSSLGLYLMFMGSSGFLYRGDLWDPQAGAWMAGIQ